MLIRRLIPADATVFLALRLEGLRESPSAFGSSYEEECDTPLSMIEARLAADSGRNMFGAFDGDQLVGLVAVGRETALKSGTRVISARCTWPKLIGAGVLGGD